MSNCPSPPIFMPIVEFARFSDWILYYAVSLILLSARDDVKQQHSLQSFLPCKMAAVKKQELEVESVEITA